MGLQDIIDRIAKEWAVIEAAPVSVAIIAALCFTLAWLALRWQYGARLAFRDDEISAYRRKLDGASPDEAAQRFADMEKRLDELRPVPIEELNRNLKHAETEARQKQIRQLVDRYLETHADTPPDGWINEQLAALGVSWCAVNKGSHYETFEPARWG